MELVKSCISVSCLINTEPLELIHLQLSEAIASESVCFGMTVTKSQVLVRHSSTTLAALLALIDNIHKIYIES